MLAACQTRCQCCMSCCTGVLSGNGRRLRSKDFLNSALIPHRQQRLAVGFLFLHEFAVGKLSNERRSKRDEGTTRRAAEAGKEPVGVPGRYSTLRARRI